MNKIYTSAWGVTLDRHFVILIKLCCGCNDFILLYLISSSAIFAVCKELAFLDGRAEGNI